jgi:hypothetical protein
MSDGYRLLMSRRHRSILLVLALIGSLLIHPAPLEASGPSQPITQVRVVHALPGTQAVDVFVDGARVLPGLAFGVAAPYINLPAGVHEFTVVPVGAVPPTAILTTGLDMAPGQPYTVMMIGAPPAPPAALVLPDARFTPIGGPARVRFVHASPNTPPLDVAVVGGTGLAAGLGFGEATPYVELPAATLSLEFRVAGTDTVAFVIPDTVLAVGTIYTFAAIGLAGATPPLGPLPLIDT